MLKRINWKQPKYILPLLILPFILLIYYVASSRMSAQVETVQTAVVDTTQLNPEIQDISANVTGFDDKISAMQKQFQTEREQSALMNIGQLGPNDLDLTGSSGSAYVDSISRVYANQNTQFEQKMRQTDALINNSSNAPRRTTTPKEALRTQAQEYQAMMQELQRSSANINPNNPYPNNSYDQPEQHNEFDAFKKQMQYIDSLQTAREQKSNPTQSGVNFDPATGKPIIKKEAKEVEAMQVEMAGIKERENFNTIIANKKQNFIQAIIDQSTKAFDGSRIRLKLLNDIEVGKENLIIKKGTYLYAFVTGFAPQRLFLQVTSIAYNGALYPVNLKIHDVDGLLGLYVPSSKFREFSKDISAGSVTSINYQSQSADASALEQIKAGLITRLFSGTTSAVANYTKSNKALIKYSTIIYLIPENN